MDPKPNPKVSFVVPFHWMENWSFFLTRILSSIEQQTFKDYEIILTKGGSMPVNTNRAIQCAKGEIIKILYMDDYLAHIDSLKNLVDNFKGGWLATACLHDYGNGDLKDVHFPSLEGVIDFEKPQNTIGSPSVIAIENKEPLMFDENMTWLLDIDYYRRLYKRYGAPTLLETADIAIGSGKHQMTYILTQEKKDKEGEYFVEKWKGQKLA